MMQSFLIIASVFGVILTYCLYQLIRNNTIYSIRTNWIETDDSRYSKYSYDYMMNPSIHNWFGLKFPLDKSFK